MLAYDLDTAHSILSLKPQAAFAADDFARIAATVDPHIEATGGLAGVLIEAPEFPGWENFGALAAHFRLVRDHHRHIGKVAVVSDSPLVKVLEGLAAHFVAAEVRRFPAGEAESAKQWILSGA